MKRVASAVRSAAALLAVAVPLAAQTASVDTVSVRLAPDAAIVTLEVPPVGGVIEALALMQPGQTVDVTDVIGASGSVEFTLVEDGSVTRLAVPSSSPVTVRYRVTGDRERIPLFVPGGGAAVTVAREVESPFLIRIVGDAEALRSVDPETSMPRMTRAADGSLEVRLSSIPALVRVSTGGPFSFARMADAAALFLILFGAVVIFRRLRSA